MPYEGYVRKISKHMPTDSYFYQAIYLAKFMMINLCGLVRTNNMNTKKFGNLRGSVRMQNMSNPIGCSMDEIESKRVNMNESESKRVNASASSTDKSKSQSVREMNKRKVKDTKDEQPLVTDNSKIDVIETPGYFKLFDCDKMFSATWTRHKNAHARQMRKKLLGGNV